MNCEYCGSKTDFTGEPPERSLLDDGPDFHVICKDCFDYLKTFESLENDLAAAKAEIINLKNAAIIRVAA